MQLFDFSDQRQPCFRSRERVGDGDRGHWLQLDGVEQRDRLADLHAGQRRRQRNGELLDDGQQQHHSTLGHSHHWRPDFHGESGRGGLHLRDCAG